MDIITSVKSTIDRSGAVVYSQGDAVKATNDFTIEGRLIRYGSPEDVDLESDYFHEKTNFGPAKTLPFFYNHGFDSTIKQRQIGLAEIKFDDKGAWLTAQLDDAEEYAQMIMQLARKSVDGVPVLGLSSGALSHLAHGSLVGKSWQWDQWILGEASATVRPAESRNRAVAKSISLWTRDDLEKLPTIEEMSSKSYQFDANEKSIHTIDVNININKVEETQSELDDQPSSNEITDEPMDENLKTTDAEATADLTEKLNSLVDGMTTMSKSLTALQEAEIERVKAAEDTRKHGVTSAGISGDFETNEAANVISHGISHLKYDNHSPAEIALMIECMDKNANIRGEQYAAKQSARAHLVSRLLGADGDSQTYKHAQRELKSFAQRKNLTLKANELMQSDLASGGDEWVGVAYSTDIWDQIRNGTQMMPLLKQIEFPKGAESMVIGKKTGSVSFYTIAQASTQSANPGDTTHTVPTSKMTTAQTSLGLSKIGAAATVAGELTEDAFLPVVSLLRDDMVEEGAEVMDHIVIDGDTDLTLNTNINFIVGTSTNEAFTAFDGIRKLALITNTANAVSVGTLTDASFLSIAALMGDAGKNAADVTKVHFLMDPSTNRKAMQLASFKTRDVNAQATIENGRLTNIYGYNSIVSYNMLRESTSRLTTAAGAVDSATQANNTKGQIVAVRPDQWLFGWRRRGAIEAQRVPRADSTEFTFILRAGMVNRDNEAAAVGYNVTV